jgi:hypothetical protein
MALMMSTRQGFCINVLAEHIEILSMRLFQNVLNMYPLSQWKLWGVRLFDGFPDDTGMANC